MNRLFFYLAKLYFKNFIIIAFGLTSTALLIDFIQYVNRIDGINRKILYFYYTFSDYFLLIYPIAYVFGAIVTFLSLVNKNHLIAFSSFGYNKNSLIKPFLVLFILTYTVIIALNFTKFAYSGDSAKAILDKRELFKSLDNIFFKYNNNFVFVKNMDIANKEFNGVVIYIIENNRLSKLLHFEKAKFKNREWIAKNLEVKILKYKDGKPQGYNTKYIKKKSILKDYYPKVLRLLYEGKRMSIYDGFRALKLLKKQEIDNSKIKAALYKKVLMPLFAPALAVLIFALLPLHRRFLSRGRYLTLTMGITLVVWATLYSSNMLSLNGVIPVDLGQPVVILLLFIFSSYIWFKKRITF